MKSTPLSQGSPFYANEYNALRADTVGAALLVAHQQLGALALGTNASDGQTITVTVNGSPIVLTGRTGTISSPGDFKIAGTAVATALNIYNALINPSVSTTTFIALGGANAQLIAYAGWALPSGGTTMTPFSLNSLPAAPLSSFSVSTTITSGTWTAQTMKLYVEPGTYYIGGTQVKFLGASTPTVTAPSANPRIDLLTINTSGTLAWVTGSEAASPTPPAYPLGVIPICELYNVVGETALYDLQNQQANQGYIQADVRPFGSLTQIAGNSSANDSGSTSATGTVTIAHGLGRTPIRVQVIFGTNASGVYSSSIATYNGTQQSQIVFNPSNGSSNVNTGGGIVATTAAVTVNCTITANATNIYLAITMSGGTIQLNYKWDAF